MYAKKIANTNNLDIIEFKQYQHHTNKEVTDLCAILTNKSIKI